MFRLQSTKAILLLIIPLLLLPLQGHARMARADVAMPCAMDHHGMHGMTAAQADHPCDAGSLCSKDCQNCAGCAHIVAGVALELQDSPLGPTLPSFTLQSEQPYSSVSLFKDHPPPRIA